MAHATMVPPTVAAPAPPTRHATPASPRPPAVRFESLVLTRPQSLVKGRSATLAVSIAAHLLLVMAVLVVPLLVEPILPALDEAIRAFFVMPVVAAPPPPPPPPPAAGVRAPTRAPAPPRPVEEEPKFVAPIEVPSEVVPEDTLDVGVEGGVPGGVEGGVPGGVVGGIVGGIVGGVVEPPVKAVRVGGQLKAPKLLHRVTPPYPMLAEAARASAMLILEAEVGTNGRVQRVTVLRGHPLFDEVGIEAVKQWRYQPLLLNGVPTPFILSVTLQFNLVEKGSR